jgi:hypothetical protein
METPQPEAPYSSDLPGLHREWGRSSGVGVGMRPVSAKPLIWCGFREKQGSPKRRIGMVCCIRVSVVSDQLASQPRFARLAGLAALRACSQVSFALRAK